ncbi:PIF1 [Mytilus coruscus]|uniref:PIF1 n=1 Tax=Mytilus coruscus TaxID=42192 RepID=A0A6J8CUD1_MYTCO|nr:PIF1 [Mytilus coruscus]
MSVGQSLHLKINCPVMLVKNLSKNLVNGLQGTVQEISTDNNTVTVNFNGLITDIKREMFTVYSSIENKVVASRLQIPLVLSYGATIHKAQGLTLDRVEVDSSNIFKAGQLGVAVATEFNLEFEENVLSESELSEFTNEEIDEIEKMVHVNENVGDPVDFVASEDEIQVNLNDCPINLDDITSCLPDMLVTDEQVLINERLNLLLEKHKLQLNLFLTTIFENISNIYEQVFGKNKTSNIKDSTELPHQQSAYSNNDAGLGKLRYIAGRCIAKSKYHYMTIGKNNMYKKNKQSCVTDCFLKVKILDYLTTTYADLLESSSYKENLEETKRKQNLTQGLTDIKDDVLDFFVDIDRNRINYQNEKMFHKHGPYVFNFVYEKLLSSKTLFTNFQKLLQNFDLTATFVRVDEDLAMACLKELYSDLILRFCRISDNQFRKDLIKSFGMQKSETLRKRVVETTKRDNTSKQISMSYILNDKSENKISSHLKLQSCICDSGTLVLKCFTKKQLMCLGKAYDINMSIKDNKQAMCDNLLATVPNFISIQNVGALTICEDHEQAQVVENLEQAPVVENLEHVPVVENLEHVPVVENLEHVPVVEDRKQSETKKRNCQFNGVDERIQCDLCDNWYHKECQNITDDQLIDITEDDWYCMKCCE